MYYMTCSVCTCIVIKKNVIHMHIYIILQKRNKLEDIKKKKQSNNALDNLMCFIHKFIIKTNSKLLMNSCFYIQKSFFLYYS